MGKDIYVARECKQKKIIIEIMQNKNEKTKK